LVDCAWRVGDAMFQGCEPLKHLVLRGGLEALQVIAET
jgi:hypothetical protein